MDNLRDKIIKILETLYHKCSEDCSGCNDKLEEKANQILEVVEDEYLKHKRIE